MGLIKGSRGIDSNDSDHDGSTVWWTKSKTDPRFRYEVTPHPRVRKLGSFEEALTIAVRIAEGALR